MVSIWLRDIQTMGYTPTGGYGISLQRVHYPLQIEERANLQATIAVAHTTKSIGYQTRVAHTKY